MIKGVGTDIIEIDRIAKVFSKKVFLEKVFTKKECEYFEFKGEKAETLAGIFAAKEAVAKAMGTGVRGFKLKDVEILHSDLGEPRVVLGEAALKVARERRISDFKLSIAHNKESAMAFVISI